MPTFKSLPILLLNASIILRHRIRFGPSQAVRHRLTSNHSQVKTGFAKEQNFVLRTALNATAGLLTPWAVPLEESGERHLYIATNGRYPSRDGSNAIPATQKEGGPMKGSDGTNGSGAYLVGKDGEFRANEAVLKELRDKSVRGVSNLVLMFQMLLEFLL